MQTTPSENPYIPSNGRNKPYNAKSKRKEAHMGLLQYLGIKPSGTMRVRMLVSVDDCVAGEAYDLPQELSDRYILRKYAEGNLSRVYGDEEIHSMTVNSQVVGV